MVGSPYNANRTLAIISKMYGWAARRGLVPKGHNPASGITRYREEKRSRFLSTDELGRLGAALRAYDEINPFAVAAVRLLLLTGARLGEILHARWTWLDTERGLLNLPESKTGKKSIYLSSEALAVLSALPRFAEAPDLIFPGRVPGCPLANLARPWAAITKAAGLERLRLHDLRHSHAALAAGAGLSLPIIGALLGHRTPAVTARYAHLGPTPMHAAAETVGEIITKALEGYGAKDGPQKPT